MQTTDQGVGETRFAPSVLLSLSTACLYVFPLRRIFSLAAEAGFDGVELTMAPEVWLRGARYVRSLCGEYGLAICSIHQTLMRISPRGMGAGRIVDAVHMALELGCPIVVIHAPGGVGWADRVVQNWLRKVRLGQELAEGGTTRLAVENAGWYRDEDRHDVLGRLSTLANVARRYDLDITLDTCHVGSTGMDLLEAYALVRERVVNVHLSDFKPSPLPINNHFLRTLLSHHQMPGEGQLPLAQLVSRLAQDGFQGPISIEIGFLALRAWSLPRLRCYLSRTVDYVRVASRTPARAPPGCNWQ